MLAKFLLSSHLKLKNKMPKIIFEGWTAGMRKISFIELLVNITDLTYSEAKAINDRIVNNNESVELEIKDYEVALKLFEESKKINVRVLLIK